MDAASFIPPAKIPTIAAAVNAACDELDGVRDGILNDPGSVTSIPRRSSARQRIRTSA